MFMLSNYNCQVRKNMKSIKEEWKDLPEYEGLYQVSNLGRIKALASIRISEKGIRKYKERILSPKLNFDKYYYVTLTKGGRRTSHRLHRLIARTFLGHADNKVVDHIDGNPLNNMASNLRYVSQSENILNPNTICKQYKPVIQLDLHGNQIAEYNSVMEAAKSVDTVTKHGVHIGQCCNGNRTTAYKYKWRWK